MKVFLSWSGEKSHEIALVFREWFPSVIQSIKPYLSSEDIDKGARWSTDIAEKLKDSSFGILCVTKDNIDAPWLIFEAGALSKTMDKSFVSPFLFGIKLSEVVDSPLLQFQATTFDKEDVFKLVITMNKACGESRLTDENLRKAFDLWWPSLKKDLDDLVDFQESNSEAKRSKSTDCGDILEEILNLSRSNQKLLRNPESDISETFAKIEERLQIVLHRSEKNRIMQYGKRRKISPIMLGDLLQVSHKMSNKYIGFQVVLNLFREDFPWLYDAGMDVIRGLRISESTKENKRLINEFIELVEFSFNHPLVREMVMHDREQYIVLRELSFKLRVFLIREIRE